MDRSIEGKRSPIIINGFGHNYREGVGYYFFGLMTTQQTSLENDQQLTSKEYYIVELYSLDSCRRLILEAELGIAVGLVNLVL